jgi:NAD(P)-dependent dehydrogenase (short-subunit alcohol dehydrogenase family)
MPADLEGLAILVTGGGRGIGRGAAELMAARGAAIGIADVDRGTSEEAAAAIRAAGGDARACPVDATDRAAFLAAAAAFAAAHGRLDGVVNSAMWIRYEPVEQVTDETFDHMLSVGLKAPVWGVQAVLAHMDPARGAVVTNFTSPAADQGYPNTSVYAAVKGAVRTITRSLAAELGSRGVRINAVTPGAVPTPGARAVVDEKGYELRRRKTPLGRLGTEMDIAHAIAFLHSADASFITGAVLHVDGGASLTAA